MCIRRAKPGDEETLAMIQIKSWQSAFADILDREMLEGCTLLSLSSYSFVEK